MITPTPLFGFQKGGLRNTVESHEGKKPKESGKPSVERQRLIKGHKEGPLEAFILFPEITSIYIYVCTYIYIYSLYSPYIPKSPPITRKPPLRSLTRVPPVVPQAKINVQSYPLCARSKDQGTRNPKLPRRQDARWFNHVLSRPAS